jgi:hypothetical protein
MVTKCDVTYAQKRAGRKVASAQQRTSCQGPHLPGDRGTMSNGRSEKRIAKTMKVEVCLADEPTLKEKTLTENVSAHGVRVLVQRRLSPKQQAVVISPNEGVSSRAKVVYCQRVAENRFAVGLELSGRVESWAASY